MEHANGLCVHVTFPTTRTATWMPFSTLGVLVFFITTRRNVGNRLSVKRWYSCCLWKFRNDVWPHCSKKTLRVQVVQKIIKHVSNGYPQDGFLPTFNSSRSGIKYFSYVVRLTGQTFSRKWCLSNRIVTVSDEMVLESVGFLITMLLMSLLIKDFRFYLNIVENIKIKPFSWFSHFNVWSLERI